MIDPLLGPYPAWAPVGGPWTPTIDLVRRAALRYGIRPDEIQGYCRCKRSVLARQEVFWLMARQMKPDGSARWSTPQIGMRVASENREPFHHTSVLHGIAYHQARLEAADRGEGPSLIGRRGLGRRFPRKRGTPGASTRAGTERAR